MKRVMTIEYYWQQPGHGEHGSNQEVKPTHVEALQEAAEERIAEMMKEGFTSGDLYDNIHMDDNDGEDGIEYSGWWSVSHSDGE